VFVRAAAGPGGATVVELGGLTRSDAAGGFEDEFGRLAAGLAQVHQAGPPAVTLTGPAGVAGAGLAVAAETTEGE